MIGAVPGIDPDTGYNFDDTKRYIDQLPLSPEIMSAIYEGNARRVYGRLAKQLETQFA
jgi:4-oxalmesaconate hydratase